MGGRSRFLAPSMHPTTQTEDYDKLLSSDRLSYDDRMALRKAKRKMLQDQEGALATPTHSAIETVSRVEVGVGLW